MNRIALSIACAACALVSVALIASQPDEEAVGGIQQALDRAIGDERHAIAFYTAVMAKHGGRRPFPNHPVAPAQKYLDTRVIFPVRPYPTS